MTPSSPQATARLLARDGVPVRVIDLERAGETVRCPAGAPNGQATPAPNGQAVPAPTLLRRRRQAKRPPTFAARLKGPTMRISETSIRRPVLATVLSLLIVLVGIVSLRDACRCASTRASTSRWSPCNTRLMGASSEVIESQVTKPLEDSIAGIDGVDIITSISRSEQSQITVRFQA